MVNRVVLVGRLTRDPEMKYTPTGVAVAQMDVAVDRFTKAENGEKETDFFHIVAWRRTAEFASNYLGKGRLISVDGRLQTRSWVAQDGTKRHVVEIVADHIQGLDRKPATEDGETPPPPQERRPATATSATTTLTVDLDLDESDPFAE